MIEASGDDRRDMTTFVNLMMLIFEQSPPSGSPRAIKRLAIQKGVAARRPSSSRSPRRC